MMQVQEKERRKQDKAKGEKSIEVLQELERELLGWMSSSDFLVSLTLIIMDKVKLDAEHLASLASGFWIRSSFHLYSLD